MGLQLVKNRTVVAEGGGDVGAAVLLLVSVLASIVPARRAARVDPVKVLR